jgi:predicted acyltransferase
MSSAVPVSQSPARLASLDVLRGMDMFCIIGGDMVVGSLARAINQDLSRVLPVPLARIVRAIPEQLAHVEWEGFHFIDLVFPLFLFLIGVAIPFSMAKRVARGDRRVRIYGHVVVRVAVLVVLGMMVNGNLLSYNVHKFQITYSVLQMLALGYLVASVLYLNLRIAGRVVATLGMLIAYWALLAFVPGPGHQIGVFQPGCNLGDWLNDWILGDLQGTWRFGWILGILGHASTAMLGVFAGELLRSRYSDGRKVVLLAVLGLVCLFGGLFWSGWFAHQWPGLVLFGRDWANWPVWFPIIKNRWTSTFALYAGGWSYLLLALAYLVIDVGGIRRWAFPFMVIGANSIFAYMAWNLGAPAFHQAAERFTGGLEPYVGPYYDSIAWAGATACLWLLLYYMYRNRTFLRA